MAKNKSVLLSAMLAVLGVASSVPARAVPIVFEFTGTAGSTTTIDWLNSTGSWDDSLLGQVVMGRITLETSGLSQVANGTPGYSNIIHYNASLEPLGLVAGELTIGGVDYQMGEYPSQRGGITRQDALEPSYSYDRVLVDLSSSMRPVGLPPTADGEYAYRALSLRWEDPNDPYGLVDVDASFDPLDLVSVLNGLPMYAQYITGINRCIEGTCMNTTWSFTNLEISSFLVHTPSVPEPGTLGLFAAGLLGVGLARRRQRQH